MFNFAPQGSEAQMCSVVSLFVNEVLRVLEEMIVSMHQENFGRWVGGREGGREGGRNMLVAKIYWRRRGGRRI